MSYGFACRSNSFQKNAFFVVNTADSVRAIAVSFRDGNFAACFCHSIYPRTVPRVHVFPISFECYVLEIAEIGRFAAA